MLKKISIAVIILAIVGGFVFLRAKKNGKSQENGNKLVKVQRLSIYDKALAIGRIEPKNEIAVKSKTSGIIKSLHVEVGDEV
ncbi:MAG: hypothetical protein ACYDH0_11230, partial [Candidatus Aminicenantales bacterium]